MKILVNAARQGRAMGGSQRYETAFLAALQPLLQRGDTMVMPPKPPKMHRLWWELNEVNRLAYFWRADVILSLHNFGPLNPVVPHVLYQRNPLMVHPDFRRRPSMRRWLALQIMRAADLIIVPSITMKHWLLDTFPKFAAIKIRVVHHGVDHILFYPSRLPRYGGEFEELTTPMVLGVGPRDPWRGLETLEDACRDLPVSLMIANGVPQENMPELYRTATIFAYPSWAESFGQPMVEAMASGLPIVAADTEINREILGDAALYFPVGDWPTLRTQLKRLIADAPLRATLGDRGFDRCQQFSWERCAREVVAVIREVVENSGEAGRGRPGRA